MNGSIAILPGPCEGSPGKSVNGDVEALVKAVTEAVMEALAAA
jgi:hypothetical protein